MEKYRLTAEEFMLIELLFLASIEEDHPEFLGKYMNIPTDKTDLRELLLSLQDKGIILKSYKIPNKGQKFDPQSIEFNNNFLNYYRKFSGELGSEFFDVYPSIAIIGGNEAPLKNYGKKFNSENEFFFQYGKNIGWSSKRHQEIIELIKWAKENNCRLLNMNIADFVISKMWTSIKELKDGQGTMNFDNLDMI